jgi:hypothetical protein
MLNLYNLSSTFWKAQTRCFFGRGSFQLSESYWPSVWESKDAPETDIKFDGMMEDMENIVFSKTIENSP